ncbi:integrase catalytic domain-containing protein [Trichonephila clavipes]|nr:integrase catalytic domain-containing protein [Trichonephila clavipes]
MYETKLFWEDKPSDLENNWAIAKRRFGNLSIKMQDNNWLYNEYKNIVKDHHIHVHHISKLILIICLIRLWFEKDKETMKVRMVFDASSKDVQVTTPLPALRVEQSAPLSVVGIDFGGPLYTKDENKHYIVLFTCAVTRAVHLELVSNLTTETFLLALRRFISRRGLYSKILTDNAKNF